MPNARQYAQDLRNRIAALRNNRPAEVLRITFDLIAQVRLRIQSRGENYEEQPFTPYTPGYSKQRAQAGYQVEYVDFTRTGRLWASVQPRVVENTRDITTVEVQPTGQDNIDKARGQVRKRGNILRPSEREIQIAADANRQRIEKYLLG